MAKKRKKATKRKRADQPDKKSLVGRTLADKVKDAKRLRGRK